MGEKCQRIVAIYKFHSFLCLHSHCLYTICDNQKKKEKEKKKRVSRINLFCRLMDLQDVNSNNPKTCSIQKIDEGGKCIQDKMCMAMATEAKASVDLHGDGKVDTPSVHMVGNDPNFENNVLARRATLHGIFKFLFPPILLEICLSYCLKFC